MDGSFQTTESQPPGWTHVVLNYIGPNDTQGIRIYHDGVQTGSSDIKVAGTYSPGDGRVVVGRNGYNQDSGYAGVDVDELLFFNEKLSDQEIMDIKDMV